MIKHPLLICGLSGAGKSRSLKNIENQERVVYLSCDAGKPLPFKHNFTQISIVDPMVVLQAIEQLESNTDYDVVIIDTLSYLMEMYEIQYVLTSSDTRSAWSHYATFFKTLMNAVAKSNKQFIFLAHTFSESDKLGNTNIAVPVKGSLKTQGLESYFTTVIGISKVEMNELKKYTENNKLLNVTKREEELGFKHVFQTKTTAKTVGDRIKGPEDLFTDQETYIDNDCNILLQRINEYYK